MFRFLLVAPCIIILPIFILRVKCCWVLSSTLECSKSASTVLRSRKRRSGGRKQQGKCFMLGAFWVPISNSSSSVNKSSSMLLWLRQNFARMLFSILTDFWCRIFFNRRTCRPDKLNSIWNFWRSLGLLLRALGDWGWPQGHFSSLKYKKQLFLVAYFDLMKLVCDE